MFDTRTKIEHKSRTFKPKKGKNIKKIASHSSRMFVLEMADTRTPAQRSHIMRAVGSKNTGPELIVRRLLHAAGFRFSLHRRDLPGSPDIVLPKHRKIVFVHGCFWHGHGCAKGQLPKSRTDYWSAKIDSNRHRDRRRAAALRRAGWSVLTVWQCQTKHRERLRNRLRKFVED